MMAEQRKRNRSSSVENSSDDSSSGLVVDYRNPPHGSSVSALMASIDSILAAETQQDAAHSSAWNTSGYQMSGLIGPSGIPSSSSSHPTSGSQGAGSQEWYIDAFETVRQSVQDLKTMLRLTDVEEEEKLPLQTRLEMLYRLDDDFQILIPPTSTLRITAQSNSRVSSQNASVPTHSASPVHSTQGSEGAGTQDIYATVEAIRDYVHDLETTLNDVLREHTSHLFANTLAETGTNLTDLPSQFLMKFSVKVAEALLPYDLETRSRALSTPTEHRLWIINVHDDVNLGHRPRPAALITGINELGTTIFYLDDWKDATAEELGALGRLSPTRWDVLRHDLKTDGWVER